MGDGDVRFHVRQLVLDAAAPSGLGYRFLTREQPQGG